MHQRYLLTAMAALLLSAACTNPATVKDDTTAAEDRSTFDPVHIEIEPLRGGIHMLMADGGQAGVTEGGNMAVSSGDDGVFLVDDQFAPLTQKIEAAIATFTDQPVRFVFNTHWHGDHTGGNANLSNSGAIIVAHDNVRRRMSAAQFIDLFQQTVPASPEAALPVITFSDTSTFHFNGQTIHAFQVTPAHTDGDVVIYFEEADVLHTGDVYFNKIYPLIDVSGGGSIAGMVVAVDEILAVVKDTTQIIPGHGAVSNRAELIAYRDMLVDVRERVNEAIAQGISEETFIASNPTAHYDPVWGQSFPSAEVFLSSAYKSLDPRQWGGNGNAHSEAHVLASYPPGAFLENLEVQADGRLLFTNYPGKTIEQLSPEGETSTFAELTGYPLGLISMADGYLVTANRNSLLLGEDTTEAQQFLLLDRNGNQTGQFDAPQARALNGLVQLDNGTFLAADSVAGTIWRVDPDTQNVSPWLQDASLAPLADQEIYKPGANGLKLRSDGLLVSNTSRGTLSLIRIGEDGNPLGRPELIATVGTIDDFWVKNDGSVLFTTHEASIKSLSPNGDITVVATQHLLGNTAIAPYPPNQSDSFIVLTDGGLYFGQQESAKVVLVNTAETAEDRSKAIATQFFTEVWNQPYHIETIDELMDEHFIITNAGNDIEGRESFKKWVQALGAQVDNLRVDIDEMMAADNGSRVITRMIASGNNNGIFGTEPDGAPISFTLISILEIRDGKITHNWVEKSAFELHQSLISTPN